MIFVTLRISFVSSSIFPQRHKSLPQLPGNHHISKHLKSPSRILSTYHLHITMSSASGLSPDDHAPFAVISRLISCLVTEQLLRAFYIPVPGSGEIAGIMAVLSTHLMSEQPVLNRSLRSNDIFAIVPLHHAPVFRGASVYPHGRPVGLVDPLDMIPVIYQFSEVPPGAEVEVNIYICRKFRVYLKIL